VGFFPSNDDEASAFLGRPLETLGHHFITLVFLRPTAPPPSLWTEAALTYTIVRLRVRHEPGSPHGRVPAFRDFSPLTTTLVISQRENLNSFLCSELLAKAFTPLIVFLDDAYAIHV